MTKKSKRILFLMGMLLMLTFLFFCPEGKLNAKAAEQKFHDRTVVVQSSNVGQNVPEEVKDPINKGLSLLVYLIIVAGIIIFLIGLVLLGITFIGHQQDQFVKGILALGVGILLAAGPFIAEWLFGINIV